MTASGREYLELGSCRDRAKECMGVEHKRAV